MRIQRARRLIYTLALRTVCGVFLLLSCATSPLNVITHALLVERDRKAATGVYCLDVVYLRRSNSSIRSYDSIRLDDQTKSDHAYIVSRTAVSNADKLMNYARLKARFIQSVV